MPRTEDLVPGLPRSGVSGSDHISLSVELRWQDNFQSIIPENKDLK